MDEPTTCRRCGHENATTQRFCGNCGASLERACPSCGETNPNAFKFCGNCGKPLTERTPAPVQTEERRWATVLFADLSGFTSLSERMDPEDVRLLVDRCLTQLGAIAGRFGGSIGAVMGDGLMALFGAPTAHGDDPERAVRAALEMRELVKSRAQEFGQLPLRVGVNTGEVMLAPVGPDERRDLTAIGDAVNIAARLQSHAPAAGILVGRETYETTRHTIRYEEVQPVRLKGKRDLVNAWLAQEASTDPGRPVSAAPMVGRDAELDLLMRISDRVAAERRPHLVTVVGPPGIGKSRLYGEFAARAEQSGAQVLHGKSLPYGQNTGYGAFAHQLGVAAGILESDSADAAIDKLRRLADTILGREEGAVIAEHLAILLGVQAGIRVAEKPALFLSARRFVEAIAADRPTLFVFEDLHWGEPALLDLIESLAARVREASALFLVLARPELLESRPGWGGGLTAYTALPLQPLASHAARSLAAHIMGEANNSVIDRVAEAAAGNPLFLEELSTSLTEGSSAVIEHLPSTVRGIIAARLDSLPAAERRMILNASVAGRTFWRALSAELGETHNVDTILESLEQRDFIRREKTSRVPGDVEFSFKHVLIREVAYSILPKAARRELHAHIAHFLESKLPERTSETALLLAHQWTESTTPQRAIEYLLLAAERARRAWAKGEAIKLYDRALEIVGERDEQHLTIRLQRALTMAEAGDFQNAAPELDSLLERLEGRDQVEASLASTGVAYWSADAENTEKHARATVVLAEQLNDDAFRAPALGFLSATIAMAGDVKKSVSLLGDALAAWPEGTRTQDLATLLATGSSQHYWVGNYEECRRLAERAYVMGSEDRIAEALINGGAQMGLGLAALGRFDEAFAVFEKTAAQGRELELAPRFTARTLCIWGGTAIEVFDHATARPLVEEAMERALEAKFPMPIVQGGIDLLVAHLTEQEYGRVTDALPDLRHRASELKGFHQWLTNGRLLQIEAELALAVRTPEEAARAADLALAEARSRGRQKYECAALITLGSAFAKLDRKQEAARALQSAVATAEQLGSPQLIWRAASPLALFLAATDDDAASAAYEKARRAIRNCSAALPEPTRQAFMSAPAVIEALSLKR